MSRGDAHRFLRVYVHGRCFFFWSRLQTEARQSGRSQAAGSRKALASSEASLATDGEAQ